MCWISTATLVLCWEKNPRCWLSCRWHAREKVNFCCALFQIPGDVQAYFLSDLWGELKKLKWHMRNALRSLFSATCKHQLMPWWLECGKFGSGREKAARGSSQSGGKKKKKKKKRQSGMQPKLGMNSFSPLPLWSAILLSPSLFFFMLQFFTTFLSVCCTFISLTLLLSSPHCLCESVPAHQCSDLISWSWIISDVPLSLRQTHFLNKGKVGSQSNAR